MPSPPPGRILLDGPVGKIEIALNAPRGQPRGIALIAHPHPLYGGTLDNKVAQTLAKAFTELDCIALRPNFRGVGLTEGKHDDGRGETEDLLAVLAYAQQHYADLPVFLAGFSFGSFVQIQVRERAAAGKLVLVAPAVGRIQAQQFDAGRVPAGTLVIHGELDETVPLAACLDWARPQELPIVVIPGADHFFHRRLHIIKQLVLDACRF